jgi:hypothetical protein
LSATKAFGVAKVVFSMDITGNTIDNSGASMPTKKMMILMSGWGGD